MKSDSELRVTHAMLRYAVPFSVNQNLPMPASSRCFSAAAYSKTIALRTSFNNKNRPRIYCVFFSFETHRRGMILLSTTRR